MSDLASSQLSFTDLEYAGRRRVTRRDAFLEQMDQTVPWGEWIAVIEPFYPASSGPGRPRIAVETMLRMYLLQAWFSLSDEGIEDAVYDSYAMRRFMRLDFADRQVPDATTLLRFRQLIQEHALGEAFLAELTRLFEERGWIMRGGSVIDATIIAAPTSTKNATGERDPEMHSTQKGNQWYFGMKGHIGVDAGTGYVHSVTVTAANVADVSEAANLTREDDEVVWGDSGYQGVDKRPEVTGGQLGSRRKWRVSAPKRKLKTMHPHDRAVQTRQASMRAKVEHPFLIIKRDFGFAKTRYRGLAKNRNHLMVLFASANVLMRARALQIAAAGER